MWTRQIICIMVFAAYRKPTQAAWAGPGVQRQRCRCDAPHRHRCPLAARRQGAGQAGGPGTKCGARIDPWGAGQPQQTWSQPVAKEAHSALVLTEAGACLSGISPCGTGQVLEMGINHFKEVLLLSVFPCESFLSVPEFQSSTPGGPGPLGPGEGLRTSEGHKGSSMDHTFHPLVCMPEVLGGVFGQLSFYSYRSQSWSCLAS